MKCLSQPALQPVDLVILFLDLFLKFGNKGTQAFYHAIEHPHPFIVPASTGITGRLKPPVLASRHFMSPMTCSSDWPRITRARTSSRSWPGGIRLTQVLELVPVLAVCVERRRQGIAFMVVLRRETRR